MRLKAFIIFLTVLLFSATSFAHSKFNPKKYHRLELEFTLEGAVMRSIISPPHTSSWLSELAIGGEVGIPLFHDSFVLRFGLDASFILNPTLVVGLTVSSSIEQNINRHLNFGIGMLFSKLFYPIEIIEGGFGPLLRFKDSRFMHAFYVDNVAFFPALVLEREAELPIESSPIISLRLAMQINFGIFKF